MSADVEELFAEVRGACSPRSWSRGIELNRADAVDGVSASDDEVVLRVKVPGQTVAPLVTLYPKDGEWVCECNAASDACEHVAAAVIALRQAHKAGHELPSSSKAGGRIGYRLRVEGDRMVVERAVVRDGAQQPLTVSLAALLSGRESGPAVEPSKVDLSIDRFLADKRVRALPHDSFVNLMALLSEAEDVELDGERIDVSAEPLRPHGVLEGRGRAKGFVLRIAANATLARVVIPGVALCTGERPCLRPLGETQLTGLTLERLPTEEIFGPERVAQLVSELLPDLERRYDLDIRTPLPKSGGRGKPCVLLEVQQHGPTLSVLPLLVYGDPPNARIDDGRLVHLDGAIPIRDERAEQREMERLRVSLDLAVGRRSDYVGAEAVAMAARLRGYGGEVHGDAHGQRYPNAALRPELSTDGLGMRFVSESGEHEADAAEVVRAFERGESLVPLMGGGWAELPVDWLGRHGASVAQLLEARRADGQLARHALPALAQLCDALEHPPPGRARSAARRWSKASSRCLAPTLPTDLRAELRDYQRRGVDWLCFLRDAGLGAVLADDMGLGKTLQALCALARPHAGGVPTSVVHNWIDEIARFRPGLRVSVYHGAGRELDAPPTSRSRPTRSCASTSSARQARAGTPSCSTRRRRSRTPTARSRAPPID